MKQSLKDKDREKYLRRTRGVTTLWPHYSSPSPTQHHTKRAPLSLQFLQWEKQDPSGHPSAIELWDACPGGSLRSGLVGITRGIPRFNHWESNWDEEVGRAHSNQHSSFGGLPFCLPQNPNREPSQWFCSSAESSWWPKSSVGNSTLFGYPAYKPY